MSSMSTKSKTTAELTDDVISTFHTYQRTGTSPWSSQTALLDLQHQLGSLTKCFMQMSGDRHSKGRTAKEIRAQISDELADIVADVLFIAHELRIDFDLAWESMLVSDADKIIARTHEPRVTRNRRA
jgi:hypothetical protein